MRQGSGGWKKPMVFFIRFSYNTEPVIPNPHRNDATFHSIRKRSLVTMREDLKSVDPAAQVLLKKAGEKNLKTAFDRAEKLKPCPIGHQGACCKMCHMGPCRLVGKEEEAEGGCGATLPVVTSRNFARMVAAGTSAPSHHPKDLPNTLL